MYKTRRIIHSMFAIRIHLSALTLTFLVVAVITKGIGVFEATVVACPLLSMILDTSEELKGLRRARISSLHVDKFSPVGGSIRK